MLPTIATAENLQLVADTRRDGKKLIAEVLDLFPALSGLGLACSPAVSGSDWRSPGH
jgi:hypothetical protein